MGRIVFGFRSKYGDNPEASRKSYPQRASDHPHCRPDRSRIIPNPIGRNSLVCSVKKFDRNSIRRQRYPVHIMWGLVVALCMVLLAFHFWPNDWNFEDTYIYDAASQEVIQLDDIQQTTQEQKRPPPPRPVVPVIVPNDEEFDEVELDLDDNLLPVDDPGTDTEVQEGATESGVAARADRGPAPRRIVEPQYPRDADRRNVRAEIVVRVLVNKRGRVEQTEVIERYLLNKDTAEREEAVTEVGYGVEEAALEAAQQWMFSPAREGGQIVQSWTTVALRFGI